MLHVWAYRDIVTRCLCIIYITNRVILFIDSCNFFALGNIFLLLLLLLLLRLFITGGVKIFFLKKINYPGVKKTNYIKITVFFDTVFFNFSSLEKSKSFESKTEISLKTFIF